MTQVKKDNNQIPTLGAVSNLDGTTPNFIKADPSTHRVITDDNTTGSDLTGDNALRDDNGYTGMMAVSEIDGITPVPLYAVSSTGALLVDST